jgi:hypothetical protein
VEATGVTVEAGTVAVSVAISVAGAAVPQAANNTDRDTNTYNSFFIW